ncbi:MAG: DUF2079 domain-containing protein [Acidimicrobiales bacterium]
MLPAPARTPPPEETADYVNLEPVVEWVRRRDPVRWALFGMIAVWSVVFISLGWRRHTHYATFGFDLGIYDQGIWLLSRFRDPFVTVRGLDLFGHHTNFILILLVPFYWLGAGPLFLLVVQVVAQGLGAVAVYLLARDRLEARWPAVAVAGTLLLHPTYQFHVWEWFHPDVLAVPAVLFAYWAARAKRWGWFAVAAVVAALCKEDVALALLVIGVLVAVRGERRIGATVAAASAAWFLVCTRMLLPFFNGIGPFYDSLFGEFGRSPTEVVGHVLTHPGDALEVATEPDRMNYYRMMLAPVAFLPLLAIPTLFIGLPMLGVNVLSTLPFLRDSKYHWSALVLAGVMLATVEAIAWLARTPALRAFLIGLVVATSFASTVAWGPSPFSTQYRNGYWPFGPDPRLAVKQAAAATVPDGAPTSAVYLFVPQMAHRDKIYEFPVPWKPINWGVDGENLHDPSGVEWLVLDRMLLSADDKAFVNGLLAHEFAVRFDKDDILVAERVNPPPLRP